MMQTLLPTAESYKADPESVYNTWFISNEERLKAFRSIRRGVGTVVDVLWLYKGEAKLPVHSKLRKARPSIPAFSG